MSDPLHTSESILLDGANSVSGAPRANFPHASVSSGAALLAALVTFAVLRRNARLVLAVLIAAALPGWYWVTVVRADAPATRAQLGVDITSTLTDLQQQAPWPKVSVQVVREDDDVLFPLGRYALPSRVTPEVGQPAIQLELRGAELGHRCTFDSATHHLVCGAGP